MRGGKGTSERGFGRRRKIKDMDGMIADVTKFCVINMYSVLVDRTAAVSSAIVMILSSVCLSV